MGKGWLIVSGSPGPRSSAGKRKIRSLGGGWWWCMLLVTRTDIKNSETLTCLLIVMLYLLYDTVYFHAESVAAKEVSFYENVIFSVPWKYWQKRV